ncbi:asparagine--tRNA ligase, chloroplastic/mitochondrial isoform X2 [Amborella trichopoda]|uniref:asparagine--tRNA ligase, chloroplastic/mitochondrial isoform X2 n=1 Tax=Amborella trichopoda TaxID=13333 RepID=UPI0009BE94BE|nr:asparagine--tRNA ligase, chloroplastic/mitochondrial isoform X2 [Amborella trichopoda]|eukprot:XP_011620961.2 asparagine--tRNA ligase, chloroplastic/mitochondrial isoform X2 [Amborella trichopoda]
MLERLNSETITESLLLTKMAGALALAAAAMATPASSATRLCSLSSSSFIHFLCLRNPRYGLFRLRALLSFHTCSSLLSPPSPSMSSSARPLSFPSPSRLCRCSSTSTGELALKMSESGEKVREFRKRLKIAEIKGGHDEGLDRLGQNLVVRGWVRTCRVQSSITFIEVNDGSCLSNMQCVMNDDAEGYDQVLSGSVNTGASVCIEGILVKSQGSKQKVELQIEKLIIFPSSREGHNSGVSDIPSTKDGLVDWSQDFFGRPAFLTVSGQLNAETYATALSDVYTFGPTFRAENSNTSRHLAEFWMIEPELAFADLDDDMACATAFLQYVVRYVLENCKEDMDFFNTWIEKGIIRRLSDVAERDFVQLTYTDAIELLLRANKKFEFPVKWGCDLQSEHERYITEDAVGGSPVIIRDYPKDIKAFYMRENDDGKTVAAMDLLVPRVGELIGGSQREERLEFLENRLHELELNKETYWWYLDLRRFGSVPHAGFGLGFERLVQFATGIDNIRDAIPFPRSPGSAEF